MAKTSKQTKKFQSKHLKHTLDHRKEQKKHKQLKDRHKKKATNGDATTDAQPAKSNEIFDDMNVEEFFEGGFEVPKEKKQAKGKDSQKSKKVESEDDESSSDEEILEHQDDLSKLAEKDPEFYKYLQDNDKDLLDFNPSNPLDAISGDEDDEDQEAGEEEDDDEDNKKVSKKSIEVEEDDKIEVTLKLVKEWNKKLNEPSLKLIKNIVSAFKSAVNVNKESQEYKYTVTDPKAFQELIFLGLKKVPIAVQKIVPYKTIKNTRTVPKNTKVKQLNTILKSHAGALLTLLNDITNTETAALVLSSVQELLPFFISFRRLLKEIITSVVNVWSSTSDVETQIAAFAFLNNSSREFSKSILENVLKLTYSSFIKNCRQTNIHTMPMINFQKNSAAELFGVDENLSYQIGFDYVRQLAIHLRNSINNTKDGYKTIYNWQYAHSLDFWSRVLSVQCNPEKEIKKQSALRQLIYPLVQVTLGAARLIPTAQFFPLRFYLIRSLIRLSQNTGVFIPLFPLLQEILNSTTLTRNPKNSNLQAFDFDHNIKVNSAYLGTRTYQQGVTEQFIDLVGEYFVLYSKSISFPELATPVTISLRRYIKTSKNVKFNKQLSNMVEKLNQNTEFIQQKRSNVEFGPTNRVEVNRFLKDFNWEKTPLGAYIVVQREVKEERLRLLRESLLEDEEERKKAKEVKDFQDSEDEEVEEAIDELESGEEDEEDEDEEMEDEE
ncbi:Nucleolar complex protein 2 [Wickerhamomyces ciferrii]|uniref:Nucleolar complex protein 2 n=1 Tax=Wickerhamomyces ciferrii (strain ATCC 14091 / BCRC 22168 / CBS 111 / JCM 3599 / NBRC 0793 / NRRL Y-1031 F-60-10) TaxID=1206466 RepID=K0KRE6_WICCF|nr:Nucleolar complex protein 2 [Wickerhamomyces ciferrii]CCH43849.1 Nucleolar complex protein 2 [Wickerhamomyces ciferrii]